jgi:hypothetical protein
MIEHTKIAAKRASESAKSDHSLGEQRDRSSRCSIRVGDMAMHGRRGTTLDKEVDLVVPRVARELYSWATAK